MCGIFALKTHSKKLITQDMPKILGTLSRRGPDENGTASFDECILGHTRLSIIDLSSGHQPMIDEKRDIAISFNGEIYNYLKLKDELKLKGYTFKTTSDTEVILMAYQEYGTDCPKYLDGMFAFVIWDNKKKILFGARDRFGEKPFYYCQLEDGTVIVSSEPKALLATGLVSHKVNPQAIDAYLALMYVPQTMSVYSEIKILPPSSSLIVKNLHVEIKKYWSLEKKSINISYGDAVDQVRKLLALSTKKMMVADVEVGSLLSGGVDSTLVTYFAQQASTRPVKTFSVGYEDYINELPYAKQASERIGTDHYSLQVRGEMLDDLISVCTYFDAPHSDSSNFPQYLISKFTSSKVKVALTGDGADELFMGYGWYWKHKHLSWRKDFLEKLFPKPFMRHLEDVKIFSDAERLQLGMKSSWNNDISQRISNSNFDDVDKINIYDIEFYLPGQLLYKVDQTAMMSSLETRCPFLDKELAEFVYSLPINFKTDLKSGKLILKDILNEIMPPDFTNRRKQGFGAPIAEWLKSPEMMRFITDTFSGEAKIYDFLNKHSVQSLFADPRKIKSKKDPYKIWNLLCLELWLKNHKYVI